MNYYKHWDIRTLIFYIGISLIVAAMFKKTIKIKEKNNNEKLRIFIYIIIYLILIFIAVFRIIENGIGGTDAPAYIKFFLEADFVKFDIKKIVTLSGKEPIFYNFIYMFRIITTNYHYVFFAIYSLIIVAYIYFLDKNAHDSKQWIFIMLFIIPYINSFNIIRNSLSVAIGLFAINALKEKRKVVFFFLSIISTLIHYTGIILLMFYFFNIFFEKIIIKYKKQMLIFLIVLILIEINILPFIKQYLNNTGYAVYLDIEYSILGYLPMLILFLLTNIFNKELINELQKKNNLIHYSSFIFNCMILPILIPFNGTTRVNIYFELSRVLIWSYIFIIVKNKVKQFKNEKGVIYNLCIGIAIIIWIAFRFYRTWEAAGIMPYYNEIFHV